MADDALIQNTLDKLGSKEGFEYLLLTEMAIANLGMMPLGKPFTTNPDQDRAPYLAQLLGLNGSQEGNNILERAHALLASTTGNLLDKGEISADSSQSTIFDSLQSAFMIGTRYHGDPTTRLAN